MIVRHSVFLELEALPNSSSWAQIARVELKSHELSSHPAIRAQIDRIRAQIYFQTIMISLQISIFLQTPL